MTHDLANSNCVTAGRITSIKVDLKAGRLTADNVSHFMGVMTHQLRLISPLKTLVGLFLYVLLCCIESYRPTVVAYFIKLYCMCACVSSWCVFAFLFN